MATTVISSKGQVIIPKSVRKSYQWEPGQLLEVIESDGGILLKPAPSFPETTLTDVAGCLRYKDKAKTLAEIKETIHKAKD